jgi:hypothetical protein
MYHLMRCQSSLRLCAVYTDTMISRVLTCCLLILLLLQLGCVRNGTQAELERVEKTWSLFPVFPGMTQRGAQTTTGYSAQISRTYVCNCDPIEVKSFYSDHLLKQGWKLVKDRQVANSTSSYEIQYEKDDLRVSIEYAGKDRNFGWDLGIGITSKK